VHERAAERRPGGGEEGAGGEASGDVSSLLSQAEEAFAEAEQALQDGDLNGYADATERARDLVAQALESAGAAAPSGGDGGGAGGSAGGGGNSGGGGG